MVGDIKMVVKTIVVRGKTRAAILAIRLFLSKNKDKKILVVVPTEHLKIQWLQELVKAGLHQDVMIEIINSAIKKHEKVDFLVLDECHRFLSDTFFTIFRERDPTIVLGLSATFHRLDGKQELLNKFCPICDIITVKEAIENKWLSPYKEYKVLLEPNDIEVYKEYNRQFNESFSFFNYDFNLAMKCMTDIIYRRTYAKKMGIASGEIDAVVFTWGRMLRARKSYVMDHPLKIEITRKILAARKDRKAITFSATIKQAEKIGGGPVVSSSSTKKKNRISVDEFAKQKSGVIHSCKSLIEGIDIPGLNLGIILCGNSSSTAKTQTLGRIIRFEEGKEAEMFTLVIAETMEQYWYATSTSGKSYIEISESELNDILNGSGTDNIEQIAQESDLLFRF